MPDIDVKQLLRTVETLMGAESWREAIEVLQQHPNVVARHYELAWSLGWAFFKLDEFDQAIISLEQATKLNPNHPVTHFALATALSENGEFERAESEFKAALSLKETYLARLGLAFLYHRQGRVEEAERAHQEGLRLYPESRERIEAYADFLSDVGREAEAKEYYTKAEQLPYATRGKR